MSRSVYLLKALAEEPAAPADRATVATKLADLFQVTALDGLAANFNGRAHNAAERDSTEIQSLCE